MLSPQKKEELKKDWFKAHKPLEDAMPGITEPVCNWWLSVIDQLLDEKINEIEDAMQKECTELEKNGVCGHYHAGDGAFNSGLEVAITILKQ